LYFQHAAGFFDENLKPEKNLANLFIPATYLNIKSIDDFIEVCKLVDKTQFMILSKKRTITARIKVIKINSVTDLVASDTRPVLTETGEWYGQGRSRRR
jgi:hypothetical protein